MRCVGHDLALIRLMQPLDAQQTVHVKSHANVTGRRVRGAIGASLSRCRVDVGEEENCSWAAFTVRLFSTEQLQRLER